MKSMQEMDVLLMEHLLVQEPEPDECVLRDGLPEYRIIDGNQSSCNRGRCQPSEVAALREPGSHSLLAINFGGGGQPRGGQVAANRQSANGLPGGIHAAANWQQHRRWAGGQ